MRCYAPSTSAIVALTIVGYFALRNAAAPALGGARLLTTLVIILGGCLLAAALIVITAATIRRRRAAAGGCLTCRHPCIEPLASPDPCALPAPVWPDRPLTRAPLPVVVVPRQRPADDGALILREGTGGRR